MSSRRLPALVGVLVLLLGFAAVLVVGAVPDRRTGPDLATVPHRLPGFSHLTADMATHPPGRALALYQQGMGAQIADVPQVVVVGADGRTVRRVGIAVQRGADGTRTDPAPVSLSPDGLTIAVGEWSSSPATPDLALVDVRSGATRSTPLPDAAAVVPLAWSRDGRQLAYLATDVAATPASASTTMFSPRTSGRTSPDTTPRDRATPGRLFVLDTTTQRAVAVPGAADVVAASFSPDATRLAVQSAPPPSSSASASELASTVRILERTGEQVAELPVTIGAELAGGNAWSPDGSLLAIADRVGHRIEFVVAEGTRTLPAPVSTSGDQVLGWLSGDEVVLPAPGSSGADAATGHRIVRADLRSGISSPFTAVPTADRTADVSDMTLATGLLPDARLVTETRPDRGPWPLFLRFGLVVLGAAVAVPAAVGLRRNAIQLSKVIQVPDFTKNSTPG